MSKKPSGKLTIKFEGAALNDIRDLQRHMPDAHNEQDVVIAALQLLATAGAVKGDIIVKDYYEPGTDARIVKLWKT